MKTTMLLLAMLASCGPSQTEYDYGDVSECAEDDECGGPICMYGPTGGPMGACEKPSGGAVWQVRCVNRRCEVTDEPVLCCNDYACEDGAQGPSESACSPGPK